MRRALQLSQVADDEGALSLTFAATGVRRKAVRGTLYTVSHFVPPLRLLRAVRTSKKCSIRCIVSVVICRCFGASWLAVFSLITLR